MKSSIYDSISESSKHLFFIMPSRWPECTLPFLTSYNFKFIYIVGKLSSRIFYDDFGLPNAVGYDDVFLD